MIVDTGLSLQAAWERAMANGGAPTMALNLRLNDNNVVVAHNTVLADLNEATFTGYVNVNLTNWAAPVQNPNFSYNITELLHDFVATGAGLPVNIYGYYIVDTVSGLLYAATVIVGGVALTNPGDHVAVIPVLNFNRP